MRCCQPKIKLTIVLFFLFLAGLTAIKLTKANFSDKEEVLGNSIQIGTWGGTGTPAESVPTPTPQSETEPTATPTPTQTPTPTLTSTPTPTPTTGLDHIVISEVYYDPDSSHMQGGNPDEVDFEWIEIYNPTSSTVNVQGWKITDNGGTERSVSDSNQNLLAGGYLVMAKNALVKNIWSIPNENFVTIGQNLGNGLANESDRVILKDNLGVIIDQMSYGDDTFAFSPAALDVVEGHSLARSNPNIDTDSAADFINQTIPNPGN